MNEIFDKLLIRILFTVFICLSLFIYRYAHILFYPTAKKQTLKKFFPAENEVDTLHLFGRLIGIALIYSSLEFNEYIGVFISSFHFFVWGISSFCLYLISIWMLDSIILYNFEYKDEILKKKNFSYGIISFTLSICLALILRTVIKESESSIVILSILWFFSLTLFGLSNKLYKYVSKLNFNALMIQKNIGLSISYSGFILGATIIITSSFNHDHTNLINYLIQILLKVLLGIFIFPLFKYGINYAFKIQMSEKLKENSEYTGFGIYEGCSYFMSSVLCTVIIEQIHFGTIYPFF